MCSSEAVIKSAGLTGDFPVGLRGRLPVNDYGARLVLFAHHSHIFRGRAGNWDKEEKNGLLFIFENK